MSFLLVVGDRVCVQDFEAAFLGLLAVQVFDSVGPTFDLDGIIFILDGLDGLVHQIDNSVFVLGRYSRWMNVDEDERLFLSLAVESELRGMNY